MESQFETQFLALRKKYIEAQFGKLNPVQRDAVFTTDGPLLILAGAGSGKTTVLVNRIANLIRFGSAHSSTYAPQGAGPEQVAELERLLHSGGEPSEDLRPFLREHTVRPYNVLAITFTNKAAGELKNRLSAMLGEAGQDVNASTFHSACVRILRREAGRLGYPQSFTIYDTDDQQRAMKEVYKSMNIDDKFLPLKSAIGAIGRLKDKMISPQDAMSAPADTRAGLVAKVYGAYQKRLLQAGAFDFDDLIYATVKLLRDFEDVREYYQNRFRYILVDEYQDTSVAQFQLVYLLGGEHRFGYPFLCETVSSVFLVLGADARTAYLLPMLAAFISVYGMMWQLARQVLGSAGKACLAFWLFFMGSGFGFVYFLGSAEAFAGIFTGFYTTPTNYTAENIVWVNPIVDLLIPQRATLFGWCVLFPALYLVWRFCMEEETRLWRYLALLVLPLPLMHTHSALALVLICLACGVYTLVCRPRTKAVLAPWGWFALVCGVVWLVEMWNTVFAQSLDGQHMLRLHLNWINGQDNGTLKDNYFWFYIKNIGLVYLLLIPAFFHAKPKQRWLYGGGLAILVLAEFVVFQPNNYDNNKLLYIWHLLGCLLVASLLMDWFSKVRAIPWRALGLCLCCFIAMFGSVLTVGREALSDYWQWSADDIAMADYIDDNAETDAVFLTSDSHLCPVFSLAGRRILCGSGSFVYYHGMNYTAEYNAMHQLYENPDEAPLAQWGIDYVLFDSYVFSNVQNADESWYAARYPLWYENGGSRIYKING